MVVISYYGQGVVFNCFAIETWGHLTANKCTDFYTDNEAVSEVINKQSSRDEPLKKLLRRLVLCNLRHNILLGSTHLLGKINILQIFYLNYR